MVFYILGFRGVLKEFININFRGAREFREYSRNFLKQIQSFSRRHNSFSVMIKQRIQQFILLLKNKVESLAASFGSTIGVLQRFNSDNLDIEWGFAELLRDPHTFKKLRKELDRIVGLDHKAEERDTENQPIFNFL